MIPTESLPELDALSAGALEALVRRHNRLYWEDQAPVISDYDYDRLVLALRRVAPDAAVLLELGEREERLGEPVQHRVPMLSLDKCYSADEAEDWARKLEGDFIVMPKLDGLACSLRYDARGRLMLAATRGTGTVGDDITRNVRHVADIPQQLPMGDVEVRGELFMRLSVFERFKDRFSNPRNLAAGAIKQKDAQRSASYGLSFAAYDLIGTPLETEEQKFAWLVAQGFAQMELRLARHGGLGEAYGWFAEQRPHLDYETDGVVFRANLVREQQRAGATAHHPRFAIAFKFQGESGRTTLEDVEWSVSRTGAITPVALVAPVQLSGASIARASLHHAGYVRKLGLSRGCSVLLTRRGGVIPHVEQVVAPGDVPVLPPDACPSCGGAVRWDGDFLSCAQPGSCRAARLGELEHYCTSVEVLGFGEKVLAAAYDAGLLQSPADLYGLTVEALSGLERLGEKSAINLVAQLQEKRSLPLPVFLRALGVPELGRHVAQLLADQYGTLERIRGVTVEELASLHSVGEVIARSVVEGLRERTALIDALLAHVSVAAGEAREQGGPLSGKSFVFTGRMASMDRKQAQAAVRALGADTPAGVSASLTHLVLGEEKDGAESSKLKSARKHNGKGAQIELLDEAAFVALLRSVSPAPN